MNREVDVPDRPQLVRIAGRAVIDDLEGELGVRLVVVIGPRLEIGGELLFVTT